MCSHLSVMSHEMEIRPATTQDVDRLGEMNKRLIEDEGHSNPMSVPELTQRMRSWLSGDYRAYLVWDNSAVVAYGLFREEERAYYLRQLFVERGHRRRGIATELLDWLFEHCWGEKTVRLEVLAHNEAAIVFYRTYGFSVRTLEMTKG